MTSVVNAPPTNELLTGGSITNARFTMGWLTFFSQVYQVVISLTMSGTTANRPTKFLWLGRFYFDTTLTKPIWVKAVSASGVATWCDATGTTV